MQHSRLCEMLKDYLVNEVLEGKEIGLEYTTPLLEWGILNSLETVRLSNFIKEQFNVQVPTQRINAESFKDISSIANLVMEF
jgi:acyl carrier protein